MQDRADQFEELFSKLIPMQEDFLWRPGFEWPARLVSVVND